VLQYLRLVVASESPGRPYLEGLKGTITGTESTQRGKYPFYLILNPPASMETIKRSLRLGPYDKIATLEELGCVRKWLATISNRECVIDSVRGALSKLSPKFLRVRRRPGLSEIAGIRKVEIEVDHDLKEKDLLFCLADVFGDSFKFIKEIRT